MEPADRLWDRRKNSDTTEDLHIVPFLRHGESTGLVLAASFSSPHTLTYNLIQHRAGVMVGHTQLASRDHILKLGQTCRIETGPIAQIGPLGLLTVGITTFGRAHINVGDVIFVQESASACATSVVL